MKHPDDQKLGNPIPTKFPPELESMIKDLEAHSGLPRSTIIRRCVRFAMDEVRRVGEADWLLYANKPPIGFLKSRPTEKTRPGALGAIDREIEKRATAKKKSAPSKEKRARLRDIREVSLSIFANIAAGWPQDGRAMKPKRMVMVPRGKYPASAFGLDVVDDSMDAAIGKFGRILPGETVVLVPFECCDKASGQIVAALVDGKTTLKRLERLPDGRCLLTAESTNPRNPRSIDPAHDLVVQGVVVGKL